MIRDGEAERDMVLYSNKSQHLLYLSNRNRNSAEVPEIQVLEFDPVA